MSQSDEQFVAAAVALRAKNLNFFKRYYPNIFKFFENYQLRQSKLDLQPDANEFDLIENNAHVYGGGLAYAPLEVEQFLKVFDYGRWIKSVNPLYAGEYKNPRYLAQHVDEVYKSSSLEPEQFKGYQIPDFFPMVIIMGVGIGKHIEELNKVRDLRQVIVFENNMDRMMASLYVTDWEDLVLPFLQAPHRSFRFVLEPQPQNEKISRDILWNSLIEYCPTFPVMSLFYNHLGDSSFNRIIDSINSDIYVHLFSFGNYDDEVNQLNNAIHNFSKGAKRLPLPSKKGFDIPICVVGSGPSLDERIDWLRDNQDRVLIISCGTALRALGKHQVTPDFHIELESDYNTFETQGLTEDKEFMKSVRLIGAAQLTPLMFSLFGEARVFFKAEGFLQGLFAKPGEAIKDAAPTCTNAGIAFAIHFGFKNIFLFGLDYGFPSKDRHHAAGSLYYKEDGPESLKEHVDYQEEEMMDLEAAAGGTIKSTHFLYTSKRRTENIIWGSEHPNILNCSNGSKIEHTLYLANRSDFETKLGGTDTNKKKAIKFLFSHDAKGVSQKMIDKACNEIRQHLEDVVTYIRNVLSGEINSVSDLSAACFAINNYLETHLKLKDEHVYYFIRGSIWHFLHAGFSHACAIQENEAKLEYIQWWRAWFSGCLEGLVPHFQHVVSETTGDDDLMLHRSISRPEREREFEYVEQAEWTNTGVVLASDGRYEKL